VDTGVGNSMNTPNYSASVRNSATVCNRALLYSCRHDSLTSGFSPCAFCRSRKRSFTLSSFALLFAVALVLVSAGCKTSAQSETKPADKTQLLLKARQIYYVLQNQGLKSFQCTIQPDWAKFAKYMAQNSTSVDDAKIALVTPVAFTGVVDEQANGTATPILPAGGIIDPSVDQMVGGAKNIIEGFFKSWGSVVVTGIFAPSDDANLTFSEQPDGYHFSQKTGDANVDIVLTRDSLLTSLKVTTTSSVIVMKPKFAKTDKGLLLSSLDSDINNGTQRVNFDVQYQTVEGFQLPEKVSYQVSFPTESVSIEMRFSKYQITKK
jgi:hypothetical protein